MRSQRAGEMETPTIQGMQTVQPATFNTPAEQKYLEPPLQPWVHRGWPRQPIPQDLPRYEPTNPTDHRGPISKPPATDHKVVSSTATGPQAQPMTQTTQSHDSSKMAWQGRLVVVCTNGTDSSLCSG